MQAWLQPTHSMTSSVRPATVLEISSGSAISARVIPTRSPCRGQIRSSARASSTIRVVVSSVASGTACRIAAAGSAIASSGAGGEVRSRSRPPGGPSSEDERDEVDQAGVVQVDGDLGPRRSSQGPPGVSSSADSRTPTATRAPAAARTACRTSSEKRSRAPGLRRTHHRGGCSAGTGTGPAGSRATLTPRARQSPIDGELGRARVAGDQFVDLLDGQRPRSLLKRRLGTATERRLGPSASSNLLTSAVEELDEQAGAVAAERVTQLLVGTGDLGQKPADRVRGQQNRFREPRSPRGRSLPTPPRARRLVVCRQIRGR